MLSATPASVAVGGSHRGGRSQSANRDGAVSVLVVSDSDAMCLGFRALLTSRPWVTRCVSASDPEVAVELAARYDPHVVVLDPTVGQGSGWRAASAIAEAAPDARLVVLTTGAISIATARSYGARALLPTRAGLEEIVRVIRQVAAGTSQLQQDRIGQFGLSPRELDVLARMASGRTNREIATQLVLSHETVKQHATAIYRKLGVRNRTEASRRANELGVATEFDVPARECAAA